MNADSSPPNATPSDDRNPIRQISKRKVLYVELDEEITSIFERIVRLNYQEVYLVVPDRSVLLQSVVNLQILKKKVEARGKSLSIITNDPIGIKFSHQVGLPVFDQFSPPPPPESPEPNPSEVADFSTSPITALSNEVDDARPERLAHKKLSIFDVVSQAKRKQAFSLQGVKRLWKSRKDKDLFKPTSPFAMGGPSKKALGTLIVASLCVLLIISYIALPGATITVTPQSNVIEQSANITLANANVYGTNPSIEGSNVMVSYPIRITIEQSLDYTSTGQIFGGTNASGVVTFINERNAAWPLVAFTRIQTEDGLVFRTQEAVTVPAATSSGFGSIDVFVVADETDAYGRVVGELGNIDPSSFFLPGLREDSRKELYARSSTPMTGGFTEVTYKVSEEDLEAAEALMASQLEAAVEEELEREVEERNTLNGTELALLTGYRALQIEEPVVDLPTNLLDAPQDQFQVSGTISAVGYTVDYPSFVEIITAELETRKSPDKILIKIDADSVSYEVFEIEETPGIVKFTANIKGIEAYDFDPETDSGAKLIKKIKEHISGKPIKEAEDYVQNLPEINKVKISSWPVWAPTIPTVLDNIEVRLDQEWLDGMKN